MGLQYSNNKYITNTHHTTTNKKQHNNMHNTWNNKVPNKIRNMRNEMHVFIKSAVFYIKIVVYVLKQAHSNNLDPVFLTIQIYPKFAFIYYLYQKVNIFVQDNKN